MRTWAEAITYYRKVNVCNPTCVPAKSYGRGYYHAYHEREPATGISLHMLPTYMLGFMHGKYDRQNEYMLTMLTESI